MSDFLKNGFICAVFAVLVFWASYDHLSGFLEIKESPLPIVRVEVVEHPAPHTKAESDIVPKSELKLQGVEFPKSYYAKRRLVETSANGIKAIREGERVTLIASDGVNMTVSLGSITITTHKDNIRISP